MLIFLKNKDYKKWKILRTKTIRYQRNFKEPNQIGFYTVLYKKVLRVQKGKVEDSFEGDSHKVTQVKEWYIQEGKVEDSFEGNSHKMTQVK